MIYIANPLLGAEAAAVLRILASVPLAQRERVATFGQHFANASFLTGHLKGAVQTPIVCPGCRHVYHQYTLRIFSNRNEWMKQLRAKRIDTTIHYPLPIHESAAKQVLLPSVHPVPREEDLSTLEREVRVLCD